MELTETLSDVQSARTMPRRHSQPSVILSAAQKRVWFIEQWHPSTPIHNRPLTFRFRGVLDAAELRSAVEAVIRRHEVLRTRYPSEAGEVTPVVDENFSLNFSLSAVDGAAPPARLERAKQLAVEAALKPFDLSREIPLRAALFKLDAHDHVLALTFHHLTFDGWSAHLFETDFISFLRASRGDDCALPTILPIQYADFAEWERTSIPDDVRRRQIHYWRNQLQGLRPLELPTDWPNPPSRAHRGETVEVLLPESLLRSLKILAAQENATLFMVLLAGFQALLARYTGGDDIAVGSPVAGRKRLEVENLIGIFINLVVLRSSVASNPTFRDFLAVVRQTCRDAYRSQDVSFAEVVEAVKPERTQNSSPLFRITFNLENLPPVESEIPGLELERLELDWPVAEYDLALEMVPSGNRLSCRFTYAADRFERATIERMAGHYHTLLASAVSHPDGRLSTLALMSAAELQTVTCDWNRAAASHRTDATIHAAFSRKAAQAPDAIALIGESGSLTFREIDRRSNQLARYLREHGICDESLVGLCVDRDPEVVVTILGILKAGGAFVPVDPSYPRERLRWVIRDAKLPIVVTTTQWKPLVVGGPAKVLCLDRDRARIAREEDQSLLPGGSGESLAYVLYTSGSTGTPKGVMGLHQGAMNRFAWMWREFPFQPSEICAQKTSLNFVDSIWELFGPLLHGVPSVFIADDTVRDPSRLIQALAEHRVTRITTVPSLLGEALATFPDLGSRLPKLKLWVSSGEALSSRLGSQFYRAMPRATLLNLYGSTEVSADVTAYVVPRTVNEKQRMPLGRPIDNTSCYVLDSNAEPVPIGVAGELCVGGDGVARGYLSRPDLTAASFPSNPFAQVPGGRLYRTGDRVRYRADGNLEYLGRLDQQVKIRGHRVELGEVESAILRHPQVSAAAVVCQELGEGGSSLVAYVALAVGVAPITSREIREFTRRTLPSYMIPSEVMIVESLPLTPNGKLNRKALPLPASRFCESVEFVPPDDPVEWQLVKIWEELLPARPIGIKQDFFELGGHSLLVIRMLAKVEQEFGIRIPVSALFEGATVWHLANCLRLQSVRASESPVVAVQPSGSAPPLFFLHGDFGGGLYCLKVSRMLGSDQPFYGVMPNGIDGKPFLPSIEAMAEESIEAILRERPEGPYLLGGYCNGAVVAYEMARQMTQMNLLVELVVMVDAWVPRRRHRLRSFGQRAGISLRTGLETTRHLYSRLRHYVARTQHVYHEGPSALLNLYAGRVKRLASTRFPAVSAPLSLQDLETSDPLNFRRYPEFSRIITRYEPQPYPGAVVLLRTPYLDISYPTDPSAGWKKLAPKLQVYDIAGSHESCLTEHLSDTAARIKEFIEGYSSARADMAYEASVR